MNKGFIMTLTLFVVGICILFILLVVLAQYLGPEAKTLFSGNALDNPSAGNNGFVSFTNPLLDFGNTSLEDGYSSSGSYNSGATNGGSKASRSPYSGQVYLSQGNATYSSQPFEEYVMIRNSGPAVNITGWALVNGKGSKPIQNSNNSYFFPTPDTAIIGQGTEFLDPSNRFIIGPIILKEHDEAYVITGGPFLQYPFSLYTSFRENACESYLESDYPFEPALSYNCPNVLDEESLRTITDECNDYISGINRCKNPEKKDSKRFDEQTTQCKNFIRSKMNYPACVAANKNSKDFYLNKWRIFLGKKSEMWQPKSSSITLYDAKGLIVDQISY